MMTLMTTVAPSAVLRTRAFAEQSLASLQATAPSMAAAQANVAASIHGVRVSDPVPQPWTRATGQQTYASQCTARQAESPR